MRHLALTLKSNGNKENTEFIYKLTGVDLEKSDGKVYFEFPTKQLQAVFDKIVELDIPFSAMSSHETTEWVKQGYPVELIAIPENAIYSRTLAYAVLNNIYKASAVLTGDTHLSISKCVLGLTRTYKNPNFITVDIADEYNLYTGKHLADLQFADRKFTTDAEAEQFVGEALSMGYPISGADVAALAWHDEYSGYIRTEGPTTLREKTLDLSSQGFYLVSTYKLKFYAPGKTKEELLNAIRALTEGKPENKAGKTSVFG